MIIALTSDIHRDGNGDDMIRAMLDVIASYKPDVYVNAGDDNGGYWGARASMMVSRMEADAMPSSTLRIKVPGNHDFWHIDVSRGRGRRARDNAGRPSPSSWMAAREELFKAYADLGFHCLNRDGGVSIGAWYFVGHSMWYESPNPRTNDGLYLPIGIEGDTHRFLRKEGSDALWDQLDVRGELSPLRRGNLAVVSHFPIVGPRFDSQERLTAEESTLAAVLREDHGARIYLNGHMHQQHLGPLRYEAGSNQTVGLAHSPRYDYPRFLLLELDDDGETRVIHRIPLTNSKSTRPY